MCILITWYFNIIQVPLWDSLSISSIMWYLSCLLGCRYFDWACMLIIGCSCLFRIAIDPFCWFGLLVSRIMRSRKLAWISIVLFYLVSLDQSDFLFEWGYPSLCIPYSYLISWYSTSISPQKAVILYPHNSLDYLPYPDHEIV